MSTLRYEKVVPKGVLYAHGMRYFVTSLVGQLEQPIAVLEAQAIPDPRYNDTNAGVMPHEWETAPDGKIAYPYTRTIKFMGDFILEIGWKYPPIDVEIFERTPIDEE